MRQGADRRGMRAIAAAVVVLGLLAAWLLLRTDAGPEAVPETARPSSPPPGAAPVPSTQAPGSVPAEPVAAAEDSAAPAAEPGSPGLPLRVVVRDGTTGEPLAGASLVLLGREGRGMRYPLRAVGTDHFLDPSPLRPGEEVGYAIEAALPEGYVKELPHHLWFGSASVGRSTGRVEASLLVWPEARVLVRVEEADGRRVDGAVVADVRSGILKGLPGPEGRTDGNGEVPLRGIPAIPGEYVRVHASAGGRGAESEPAALVDPRDEVCVRVVLPAAVPRAEGLPISAFDADPSEWAPSPAPARERRPPPPPPPPGSLLVRVLRRDGTPAAGTGLYSGGLRERADPKGVVRFASLPPGDQWVMSADVGFHLQPAQVAIASGAETVLEMRELPCVDVLVVVLDAAGAPTPGALLDVRSGGNAPVCVLEGGAQQIGLFTGPDGRRAIEDVPIPAWITARLGSRSAAAAVECGGAVEIRLPPAK